MVFENAAEATRNAEQSHERVRNLQAQLRTARQEARRLRQEEDRAVRAAYIQRGQAVEASTRAQRDAERAIRARESQQQHITAAGLPADAAERLQRVDDLEARFRQLEIARGAEMTDQEYWQHMVDTYRATGDEETALYIEQEMLGKQNETPAQRRESPAERATRATGNATEANRAEEAAKSRARNAESRVTELENQVRHAQATARRFDAQARTAVAEASTQLRQAEQAQARLERVQGERQAHIAAAGLPADAAERLARLDALQARIATLEAEKVESSTSQVVSATPVTPQTSRGGRTAGASRDSSARRTEVTPDTTKSAISYSVRPGDSLWRIIREKYRKEDNRTPTNAETSRAVTQLRRFLQEHGGFPHGKEINLIAGQSILLPAEFSDVRIARTDVLEQRSSDARARLADMAHTGEPPATGSSSEEHAGIE